jgi:hypothetical protein
MSELYRLKEEVKKYFRFDENDENLAFDDWAMKGVSLEALEEVEERIELKIGVFDNNCHYLYKNSTLQGITFEERDLCEKALNKELLDIDSFVDFVDKYRNKNEYLNPKYLRETLKQYLKEKK